MKTLAMLTVSLLVLTSTTLGSLASSEHPSGKAGLANASLPALAGVSAARLPLARQVAAKPGLPGARAALQTGATSTGTVKTTPTVPPTTKPGTATTVTPSPSPTATPSATPNPAYPDPTTLLQDSLSVLIQIRSIHFQGISDLERSNHTERLTITTTLDATCTGQSMSGQVTAKDVLEGTSQSQSFKESFVRIKKKVWIRSKKTKSKWTKTTATGVTPFGSAGLAMKWTDIFPLACGSQQLRAAVEPPGQTSPQIKDLVNLGPETFRGSPAWHIHGTVIRQDTQGNELVDPIDFLIAQGHPLLDQVKETSTDTQNGIVDTETQIYTKYGEKITIKAPKV